jgi:hypothetical protein
MTVMNPIETEEEELAQLPFVVPELAPYVFLTGVEVEVNHAAALAVLTGWQECPTIERHITTERRIVARIALTLPVATVLHRKLGEALSRPRSRVVTN